MAKRLPFEFRIATAEVLLREREAAARRGWPQAEWTERHRLFRARSDDGVGAVAEGLLLAGREWLRTLNHRDGEAVEKAVYGDDTFDPLSFEEGCESARVWGYVCPFETVDMAADHLFPKSLGGPTVSDNRLTLCRWHNTAKSMDVHLFPWEDGIPGWVPGLLRVLAGYIQA